MNDDYQNWERLQAWLEHLKHGIVLQLVGNIFTWVLLVLVLFFIWKK